MAYLHGWCFMKFLLEYNISLWLFIMTRLTSWYCNCLFGLYLCIRLNQRDCLLKLRISNCRVLKNVFEMYSIKLQLLKKLWSNWQRSLNKQQMRSYDVRWANFLVTQCLHTFNCWLNECLPARISSPENEHSLQEKTIVAVPDTISTTAEHSEGTIILTGAIGQNCAFFSVFFHMAIVHSDQVRARTTVRASQHHSWNLQLIC